MAVAQILKAACLCTALAALVGAWRVYRNGLVALYPAFFLYLLSQGILLAVSGFVGASSHFYVRLFLVASPLTWGVNCLMVRELYNQIFDKYPGIAMFGRWSVYLAFMSACAMAVAANAKTHATLVRISAILVPMEVVGRDVVFGLAISIIVLLLSISRYPLQLHRNVLLNFAGFSTLLLGEAAEILANHLTDFRHTVTLDVALMALDIVCFSVWGLMLSPQGVTRIVRVRHGFSAQDERRLLGQLDALNAFGVRAWRK